MRFAAAGFGVVVSDLGVDVAGNAPSTTAADAVVEAIIATGGRAVARYGSVADFATAQDLVDTAVAEFGSIDAMVTCHGILRERMIFNMSEAEWDSVIAVHLRGTFACFRFASARMREQRDGSLIALGSAAGMEGSPAQANYAAAKAGIVGLVFSTALAMGRYGVNANCIVPAAATRMTARLTEATTGTRAADERQGPELIAELALALAQPQFRTVTGQVLTAAGRRVAVWEHPSEVGSVQLPAELTEEAVQAVLATALPLAPLRRFAALNLPSPSAPAHADAR